MDKLPSEVGTDFGTITSEEAAELFPMEVTPWEKYLMADDCSSHPMSFFAEAVFAGPLDRSRLNRALGIAVHRNPLMASKIITQSSKLCWQYDSSHRPVWLNATDVPPIVHGLPRPFDLRREFGARYWYDETPEGSRFLVQVHHAVADGVGLRHFFIEITRAYARLATESSAPRQLMIGRERPKYRQLLHRFTTAKLMSRKPEHQLTFVERVRNLHYFFLQKPVPLRGSVKQAAGDETTNPSPNRMRTQPYLIGRLDEAETDQVRMQCREAGVSLSEAATALLLQSCRRWNEERGVRGKQRRIRLLIPYDLRDSQSLRMSAANKMSYAFVGRTHGQCQDWQQLLYGVRREMQWIKDKQVTGDFLQGLEGLGRRPNLLKLFVRANRNMATAVLTYAGDFYRGVDRYFEREGSSQRIGDSLLLETTACPPIRSFTNVAICVALCRSRLYCTLNWNPSAFTQRDAEQFLEGYLGGFLGIGNDSERSNSGS